ncbi:solute carrier family 35 member F2-like isoform X1 [Hordeum vulgare subsp. vulgare]|uniref:Predicted protein n=1 Tax=Hordeum vulgare subsp. vulgare TaxID=112509 RepID=F2D8C7_HORVV|nr:solute carrier family 35 member F2-like isoform X1 [Hordeum vulgare subsp. vulgare]BAJ91348.1 predicted protein [Hordeum vulgare subsp. vulgare]
MDAETKAKDAWRLPLVLFLGQLVAFSMASASFASSFLANLGVNAPLTQSFFAYLLLTLIYVPILLHRRQKPRIPWYWYLALAFVDVQGNYLVVKAYQYSSITSVTLLDCWTVVWVIILTWYALGTRYSFWQFLGAGTCVAGLGLVLLSDAKSPDEQDPGRIPLLGDALVIAGTVCFAFSNVAEEYCVKKNDRVELIGMLGLFGLLVSAIQIFIFERKSLEAVAWSPTMVAKYSCPMWFNSFICNTHYSIVSTGNSLQLYIFFTFQISLFAGYAVALLMFYTITPFVLKMSGSTLFNLSLLTSDMWAVAIRLLIYRQQINWLYYVAFAVVAIGLIVYSLNESSSADGRATGTEAAAQYQQLPSDDNSTSSSNLDSKEKKQLEEAYIC